nr:class I SAM-dependent methyltransferase [Massilia sp. TS11]
MFPVTLLIVYALARQFGPLSYLAVALVQGVLAMGMTWLRGLASWWRPIQFAFPLCLVVVDAYDLPPSLFLTAFLGLVLVYWSTYRTQVPYYPSGAAVWEAVLAELPPGPCRVIDIGSGLGGVSLFLAARRPDAEVWGVELAPLPWAVGAVRARLAGSRARMLRGDYEQLHFGDFDLVFAYLSPAAMPALYDKARAEMRPGSQLFSYEFAVPGHPATRILNVGKRKPLLHGWKF